MTGAIYQILNTIIIDNGENNEEDYESDFGDINEEEAEFL